MRLALVRRAFFWGVIALGAGALSQAAVPTDAQAQPMRQVRVRPWLGVSMEPDDASPAAGVLVKHVVRGSPAQHGGVREGDHIVAVQGSRVSQPRDVMMAVSGHRVGEAIGVTIARGGRDIDVNVTLGAFPGADEMIRMDHLGTFAPSWRGLEQATGTVPRGISDLRGRVVLIDFWATWCGPCRVMGPKLDDLQTRYGAQGLSVVGISTETRQEIVPYAQAAGMRYGVASDPNGETTQAYTVSSLPTIFVVDKRGVVREIAVGYEPGREAQLEQLVRTLLAEPAPTG